MPRQIGAIASGHQASADAGARMLSLGGNAIDAAVACAFASCTCEPTLTGPGGGGFATIKLADTGECVAFDFFAAVPGIGRTIETGTGPIPVDVLFGATTQTFHVGPQSVAVPGFVAGLLEVHERYGRLPRAEVLQPGIELARDGLVIGAQQAYCHKLLEGIVTRVAGGREIFAPQPAGAFLVEGDRFQQPRLATTFELLARDGAQAFYEGELAEAIVAWADDNGGLLTMADLAAYRVRKFDAVRSTYRGLEFCSVPPPSSGGALTAYALRLLDEARAGHALDLDTPEGAALLVAALNASNTMRGAEFDHRLYGDGLVEWLLDDIRLGEGLSTLHLHQEHPPHPTSRLGSTTHLSVIDAEGNAVAMTTTTGCGSGEFAGDTGIHLNNMLGEEDLIPVEHQLVPGDRLTSMMAPSLMLADGAPLLATGSAGSSRIRSAILQTLVRVIESRFVDEGSLQTRLGAAVDAERLHAEGGVVHAEPGPDTAVVEHLRARGHHVNLWPSHNLYFGGVNMVAVNADGSFAAAADPRRGGGTGIALDDGSVVQP